LVEIRSTDLSFSNNDISFFFNKKLKFGLSIKDIRLLEAKTEGWIAGLQLTAITIQGRESVSEYIEKLAGDNRYIMDYLIEEVLYMQTEEVQEFLLNTSLLEKFCGSLCNAVLKRNNSQSLLESIERNNMFIVPLDNERKWFRYHHLFANLLKQKLINKEQEISKELHLRASYWHEQNNMPIFAIEHALEANNNDRAMHLINKVIENLWENGQHSLILKLGGIFPDKSITTNTKFCIYYTWMLIRVGRINEAEKYLKETEQILLNSKHDNDTKHKDILGKLSLIYAFLYVLLGNMKMVLKYSEQALLNLSDKNALWNGWAYIALGDSDFMNANMNESEKSYINALNYSKKTNSLYLQTSANYSLAFCYARHGMYKNAYSISKKQLKLIGPKHSDQALCEITSAGFYSIFGLTQTEWNSLQEGLLYAQEGYNLSKKDNNIRHKMHCALMLMAVYYSIQDYDNALQLIEELQNNDEFKQTTSWLNIHTTAWKARILIKQGELEKASVLLNFFTEKWDIKIERRPFTIRLRLAELYIAQFKIYKALELLERLTLFTEEHNKSIAAVDVELLKAKANKLINRDEDAIESIIKAVVISQTEGYIRSFINVGPEIEELLKEISKLKSTTTSKSLNSISREYLNDLLYAFEKEKRNIKFNSEEILSSRELDILKLVAENLSNQEIANKLFISQNTVKTHLKNIYFKLEVNSRTKAANKAKELNLF